MILLYNIYYKHLLLICQQINIFFSFRLTTNVSLPKLNNCSVLFDLIFFCDIRILCSCISPDFEPEFYSGFFLFRSDQSRLVPIPDPIPFRSIPTRLVPINSDNNAKYNPKTSKKTLGKRLSMLGRFTPTFMSISVIFCYLVGIIRDWGNILHSLLC